MSGKFFKANKNDKIWWVDDMSDRDGVWLLSFDRKTIFNMFADYPYKLTPEQKAIFDEEYPEWARFFAGRSNEGG